MATIYSTGIEVLLDGTVSWANSTIKALIVDSGYTFDKADEFVSDLSADEVTNAVGTGYARKTLTNKTVTLATDIVTLDADDLLYTAVQTNETWDALIVYAEGTADANSPLLAYLNIDNLVTNGSDASITLTGVLAIDNS
jgi:hypothetical protein